MNRRKFSTLLPALMGVAGWTKGEVFAQAPDSAPANKPAARPRSPLPVLEPGVFPLGETLAGGTGRKAHQYFAGMLVTGNIRLESHVTVLQPGAPHEAVDKHLHSEMWLMREGTVELNINGEPHTLNVGDVGLVTAGNLHYVKNIGTGPASYFVVTLGPPE